MAVHPPSIRLPPQPRARLLGPGTPAAPDEHSLLLLPSGPDRVRRSSPRRTRPSTLRCPLSGGQRATSNGTSTPLERVSGYNGPLLRRLARPLRVYRLRPERPIFPPLNPSAHVLALRVKALILAARLTLPAAKAAPVGPIMRPEGSHRGLVRPSRKRVR